MRIGLIANNTFDGKIKYGRNLTQQKKQAIDNLLDFKINEKTIRERIKRASYDVEFYSKDTKKTKQPTVSVYSFFKTLHNYDSYQYGHRLKLNNSLEENAKLLNNFLDFFELMKKNYYYSYNSFGEKLKAFFKHMFNIR